MGIIAGVSVGPCLEPIKPPELRAHGVDWEYVCQVKYKPLQTLSAINTRM